MARITVINDSSEFLDLMRDLLTDLGHEMTGFKGVETSIEQVIDSHPDLMIVDLRLDSLPQQFSGWELLVLARSHRQLKSKPIILCTADVWQLKKRAADLEHIAGVHVRTLPFDVDDIAALIEQLVESPRDIQSA